MCSCRWHECSTYRHAAPHPCAGKAGSTALQLAHLDPTGLVAWRCLAQSADAAAAGPGSGSLLLLASPSKRHWRGIQSHVNNAVHGVMQARLDTPQRARCAPWCTNALPHACTCASPCMRGIRVLQRRIMCSKQASKQPSKQPKARHSPGAPPNSTPPPSSASLLPPGLLGRPDRAGRRIPHGARARRRHRVCARRAPRRGGRGGRSRRAKAHLGGRGGEEQHRVPAQGTCARGAAQGVALQGAARRLLPACSCSRACVARQVQTPWQRGSGA